MNATHSDLFDDPVGDWARGRANSAVRDFAELNADQLASAADRRVPGSAKAVRAALDKAAHPHPDDPDYLMRLSGLGGARAPHFYADGAAFKAARRPSVNASERYLAELGLPPGLRKSLQRMTAPRPPRRKKPKRKKASPAGMAYYENQARKLRKRRDGRSTGSAGLDHFIEGGTVDLYGTLALGRSVAAERSDYVPKGLWMPAVAKNAPLRGPADSRPTPKSSPEPDPYVAYYAACGNHAADRLLMNLMEG